ARVEGQRVNNDRAPGHRARAFLAPQVIDADSGHQRDVTGHQRQDAWRQKRSQTANKSYSNSNDRFFHRWYQYPISLTSDKARRPSQLSPEPCRGTSCASFIWPDSRFPSVADAAIGSDSNINPTRQRCTRARITSPKAAPATTQRRNKSAPGESSVSGRPAAAS